MYSIGRLSKETGITVRTLHYYDELGLLEPSYLSEAGYRYYEERDVMRLHEIVALKKLGFTLAKIKGMVTGGPDTERKDRWKSSLTMELAAVRSELQRLSDLEKLIHITLQSIEIKPDIMADDLFLFIRSIQSDNIEPREKFRSLYFTEEERPIIEELPELGNDDPRTLTWVSLLGEIRSNLHEPPDSPVSRKLAQRIIGLTDEFFGGNEELVEKYWGLVRPDEGMPEKVFGMDKETMDYMDRIIDWYIANGEKGEKNADERVE
ncbi:MerR family transcriptional regulator [Paenibacillus nasutitermitis]|uniref:MerR family transcriptional regulator n=1 Tax=Paenibacillus nasutitermitis TaxID=1652958 RepID=A0A916ZG64_9BACL|nr:MerR family transcriptional regulator [Paenibacillus nasutitermitis]GGD94100.1 MerR family transcriptional regulator [Paenibacillus nasutitermitis]